MPNNRQGIRAIVGLVDDKNDNSVWFATGEVSQVRKSDRRVRVKILPEGLETNWIRIIWPLAGQDYGIYVLPEVGTELGLLFVGSDPNWAYAFGNLNDDDDTLEPIDNDYDLFIKPKYGGSIKITKNDGITIYTEKDTVVNVPNGKTTVNCDHVHLGGEGGGKVLTSTTFMPKYNADMQILQLHSNMLAPDPTLATIGNAIEATHAATKVDAE